MHPELLVRKRMMLMTLVLLSLFGLVLVRVAQLTTVQSDELTRRGVSQWTKAGIVAPRRGKIVDRNGNVLVVSATSYTVCADPRIVSDEELFLDTLAPVLPLEREGALKKLRDKTKGQIILKRQVPRETVDRLRTLKTEAPEQAGLRALVFEEDARRWYPYGEMLSQVLGLTKTTAREFASRNITANAVCPGYIATDMTEKLPQEARDAFLVNIPLKRAGQASDVAGVVCFFCSPEADYVTGQALNCDGGFLMS